ncbi:sulfate adenylyltransferase subunit 1 [alpha proteobacterium U9-1i]|nr:sulfate adenylyltransferase subunit 1 [alpha proteobacterium U9-1i]
MTVVSMDRRASRVATQPSDKPVLRFTTAGNVDDGKSTLIGRLLFDGEALLRDQVSAIARAKHARAAPGEIDLALVTDGLEAEREQGITIDVAYRYFATPRRSFIIADAPGHEQYTRNMVTAASQAELAVILVDATRAHRGALPRQTRRHAAIAALMGLDVIVAVNKLDLVNYDEAVFDGIAEAFEDWAVRINLARPLILPIAAKPGDNVSTPSDNLAWWRGPTLLQALEAAIPTRAAQAALRFPVQRVLRARGDAARPFRGYAGRIESGALRVGDVLRPAGGDAVAVVSELHTPQGSADSAPTGASVTIVLDREIDLARGDVLVQSADTVETTTRLQAEICWLDTTPLQVGRRYLLKQGARTTQAIVREVSFVRDLEGFAESSSEAGVSANDIARVELQTKDAVLNDDYAAFRGAGGFVLMDGATNQTVAAGVIRL